VASSGVRESNRSRASVPGAQPTPLPPRHHFPRALAWAIGLAVAFGVLVRFAGLDTQVHTADEAWTSLRLAARFDAEVASFYDGRVHSIAEWRRGFQTATPDRPVSRTVAALAHDESHWPPLYYVVARGWALAFGSDLAVLRLLSAILGTLAIAAAYWFGWELTRSRLAAALFTAFIAVSPLVVSLTRAARGYALYILLLLVSCAALLRALDRPERRWWLLYAASALLALYTNFLMICAFAGQALFVAIHERRRPAIVKRYALWAVPVALAYLPWFAVVALHRGQDLQILPTGVQRFDYPLATFIVPSLSWNAIVTFFALPYDVPAVTPLVAAILALAVGACAYVVRFAPPRVRTFLLSLALPICLFLGAIDVKSHTAMRTVTQYELPAQIALACAVAAAVAWWVQSTPPRLRRAWFGVVIVLLFGAAASSATIARATYTWLAWDDGYARPMAAIVEAGRRPLLVERGDGDPGTPVLANLRTDRAALQLLRSDARVVHPAAGYDATFVLSRGETIPYRVVLPRGQRLERAFVEREDASQAYRFYDWTNGIRRMLTRRAVADKAQLVRYTLWRVVPAAPLTARAR